MNNPAQGAPSRRRVVIATVIAVVALTGVVLLSMIIWLAGCGGDGGSPYAAPASPRGEYCELTTESPVGRVLAMLLFTFPVYGMAALGIVSVVTRSFKPLLIGIAVSALLLAGVLSPMLVLDRHCSADQRASLPSHQCETYN
jgi:hypothetical protein